MAKADDYTGTILKYHTKKGKLRYQCRIKIKLHDNTYKYFNASAASAAQARILAKQKYHQFKKNNAVISPASKTQAAETISKSITDFYEIYSANWSSSTKTVRKSNIDNMILSFIGKYQVKNINVDFLDRLFRDMLQKYSRQNVGMMYAFMRDYIAYLAKRGIIADNYFADVAPLPKRTKPKEYRTSDDFEDDDDYKILSENEIRWLSDLAYNRFIKLGKGAKVLDNGKNIYKACIFYALFLTGMRSGEIRALTTDDIDFTKHLLRINKTLSYGDVDGKEITLVKTTKTVNSKRYIGINQYTEDIFKRLIDLRPCQDTKNICCGKSGDWIPRRTFIKYFDSVLKWLDIPKNGRSPHCLRHTFVSYAIERNALSPLSDKEMLFISRYVGHKDLTTTLNIYAHLCKNKLSDVTYDPDDFGYTVMQIDYAIDNPDPVLI